MVSFVEQFLRAPRQTGAIVPSGRALTRAMLRPIDFGKEISIVELGAGTGVFTKEILKSMNEKSALTIVEINPEFCDELKRINDPRLRIIHGDACDLEKYVPQADYVVSGLPLVGFPKRTHERVLKAIRAVTTNAYIQFHYSRLAERQCKAHFAKVTRRRVWNNIPPAIVYVSSKG